jgi:fucose 4-O-acetylase-like acetyltransferase
VALAEGRGTRDATIDVLRGVAIMLVVIGHSISSTMPGGYSIVRVISSFHMPLFMVLSGYLAFGRVHRPLTTWISKKALRLGPPYLFALLMSYALGFSGWGNTSVSLPRYLLANVVAPNAAFWFLYVLFECFVLLALCAAVRPNIETPALLATAGMVWAVFALWGGALLGLGPLHWYFAFFTLGFLFARYREHLLPFTRLALISSALVFPVLSFVTWQGTPAPWYRLVTEPGPGWKTAVAALLLAVTGSILVWGAARRLVRTDAASFLTLAGQRSLDLYVLSGIFLGTWLWTFSRPMPGTVVGSVVFTAASVGFAWGASWALRALPSLGTALLGADPLLSRPATLAMPRARLSGWGGNALRWFGTAVGGVGGGTHRLP